jgi:hypothetical protein
MMEIGKAHVDDLSIAVEEMKRVAQVEGVETLLIVATQHRSDGSPHRVASVGSIDGCPSCAMESLGRFIGMRMSEMMIADHLDAIQSAYAERMIKTRSAQPVNEVRKRLCFPEERSTETYVLEFSRG